MMLGGKKGKQNVVNIVVVSGAALVLCLCSNLRSEL